MPGALGGPRVLLRRLREVMAEPVSAQERLDKIVVLIAANMVAEVCSVYVLRVDGTLELYATEGLKREAVHQTVLRQDEGLVGLVASEANPINLSEAQTHPAFSFRPETGEEIYHSFLGVPVLRAGNTLGVLVVQNRASRAYSEEEEEALQTTAMVLAEMIASGELSVARPARRRARDQAAAASHRPAAGRRHRARPRGAARAARHGEERHRRRRAEGAEAARRCDHRAARRPRSHAGAPRRRRRRRAPRGARRLPQLRPRPGLAAPAARSGRHRPDRRGRRRARAVRQPRPHAARHRSLYPRAAARPRRSRQPADAPAHGPGSRAAARAIAGQRHPGRPLDGPGGAARLRPQEAARPDPRGRRPDLACRDRGARARHRRGRRGRQHHRHGRIRRCRHRRRLDRRRASAAGDRHRDRLRRARQAARPPPGAIPRAARQALRHQGRPAGRADDQRRPAGRSAASRRNRRRRHRPVPHRIAVHDRDRDAAHQRSAFALPRGARRRAGQAGDLPHARHRRRQDPALHAPRGGGESRARLARDPARPRPARPDAEPDPGAAAGRRRARVEGHVPDGRDLRRVRRGQGADRARADRRCAAAATSCRTASRSAPWSRCRRCCSSSTR